MRWRRVSLALVVLIALTCLTCSATSTLLSSLPETADGIQFEDVIVVDQSFSSGHPIDDVLESLGKTRRDATAVFRGSAAASATVGAILVQGVSGGDALNAVVQHWQAAALVSRNQTEIGGRAVWLLEFRPDQVMTVHERGEAVYLVAANDRSTVARILPSLP